MSVTRNRPARRLFAECQRRRLARVLHVESLEARRCLSASPGPMIDLSQIRVDADVDQASSILVRYRAGSDPVHEPADLYGPSRTSSEKSIGFGLQRIDLRPGVSLESVLGGLRNHVNVLYAEPDYPVRIAAVPNDPLFADQWDFDNTGQSGGVIDADIDAPDAWDISTGSGSTIVAVIDTGVDYLHPDLAPNMWTNPGEIAGDGIDNDNNGYVDDVHGYDFYNGDGDPRDDHNHGTHVAGTIGAEGNDGIGIAGVNWGVQIMALKFLGSDGSGTTSAAIEAVSYAVDNGAQISNNSWGGDPYSQALYDVIADARDQGHIFVAAAGNGNFIGFGQDNDTTPFYPAGYDLDNIVSVAATDRNDQRAIFSNFGATTVDVGAPGVDILSTTINGNYGTSSGTSMAAPHIAGALSLLRDHEPSLSYRELIDRVILSADPIEALEGITVTGGRLNLASALVPDTFGPQVVQIQPGGLQLDPFDRLRISFDESVDLATFTVDDIADFSGPHGVIPITGLVPVSGTNGRQFDLTFPLQSDAGDYDLILNPGLQDRFGNVMDQNDNGIGGEIPGDRYAHRVAKADAVARFDFGTTSSPVAPYYTGASGGDRYSESLGYGWQGGPVYSLNRGGDALTGDVNYTRDSVFAIDLPNGEYDVIVTLGEPLVPHDQMGISLEGVAVDTVSTAASVSVSNTYRTSVSDGQLNLGLKDLGGSDPWVMINAVDVVFAGPDQTAPRVTSSASAGVVEGPVDRIVVGFSESIAAATFTVDDVSVLEGPDGPITPTGIEQVSAGEFAVTFDPQNTPGDYRMVVGPQIADIAENLMDQDGDGIGGEAIDDRFETRFTLEPGPVFVGRFDFGTTTSPVAAEYIGLTGANRYSAVVGYGWQEGTVYSLNRGGDDLTRDHNYTRDASFAFDLPNGEYDVTVTMGEALVPHDQMGVSLEGVPVASVSTASNEFAVNTFRTSISDGQLTLGLRDLGGSDPWVMINALDIVYVGPDQSGPAILSAAPTGTVDGPIDHVTVTFNEAIETGTFTLQDVVLLEGPDGALVPTAVTSAGSGTFRIEFDETNAPGQYRVIVGPEISDIGGNLMDQDGDGITAEPTEDRFEWTFTLEAGPVYAGRFDFGTTSSPVASEYTRVTGADRYDVEAGHGWQGGTVYSLNRGGDALTRDHNYTRDATFALDLPNGEYDVTVTLGEALIPHDLMGVSLEGVPVDSVSTAGGQFAANTYRTSISDGQLNLGLIDLGGTDPWVTINALDVVYAGPDQTGPSVFATDPSGVGQGPIDRITVTFDEPIDAQSFTLDDILQLDGPDGPIVPTGVVQVAPGSFEVSFPSINTPGEFQLVLGPEIADVSGNLMDQDRDGTLGETIDDRFELTFVLQAGPVYVARYDFGTTLSPLAEGYTRVSGGNHYDPSVGHGWQGAVYSINRGGDDLTRDLNYTRDAVFAVDLANGEYDVVITMGEALIPHDLMSVVIEGQEVDLVNTASFQYVTNTYRASVSDGQLSLGLHDLGGSNPYAVINALDIILAVGPGAAGIGGFVAAADPEGQSDSGSQEVQSDSDISRDGRFGLPVNLPSRVSGVVAGPTPGRNTASVRLLDRVLREYKPEEDAESSLEGIDWGLVTDLP